jgi:para-aminobenzoate synthetase component I
MLSWASRFDIFCFLDNHNYRLPSHSLECILAVGARDILRVNAGGALDQLQAFTDKYSGEDKDWLFGHFGYGLARETEPGHWTPGPHLPGRQAAVGVECHALVKTDPIGFPDLCLFVPEIVIELTAEAIWIGDFAGEQEQVMEQIVESSQSPGAAAVKAASGDAVDGPSMDSAAVERDWIGRAAIERLPAPEWTLQPRLTREAYLETVIRLQEHILRGDCYEINFCQEFFAQPAVIDPLQTWQRLSAASPNPFAAFYRLYDSYLLCASPERYLKREGDTLISQPIKGTSPRIPADRARDEGSRDQLFHSAKDRAENVMVVDLVRNDLSKICREGTVRVEELFGVYSFPNVHQMVSTIKGELLPGTSLADCIRASFPMGSMTGAPKNRVVGLIEAYESTARGIFSGAVGYIDPDGNFDFNVVIRSILYNSRNRYLSYQVGSGITYYSDPEAEYEEGLWKAKGMIAALAG